MVAYFMCVWGTLAPSFPKRYPIVESSSTASSKPLVELKGRPEWLVVGLFATIQLVHILDFVLMMPLGPSLMADLGIDTTQFGLLVSSYSLSAALVGLVIALVMDRFDRKNMLFTLLFGFVLSTTACGLSHSYTSLLIARILAGAFGGVVGGCVFTMIGEIIPVHRRGRTMGIVMSSFSIATVAGVPLGLALAEHSGWQAPFLALGSLSFFVMMSILLILPPMKGHISNQSNKEHSPLHNQMQNFIAVFQEPLHRLGFLLAFFVMFSGFIIIPYIAPRLIGDLGLPSEKLSLIYLFGGLGTIISSQIIGRCVDAYGHLRIFLIVCQSAFVPLLLFCFTGRLEQSLIFILMTSFLMLVSGRMVPTMSLVTAAAHPKARGAFMSVFQSVQAGSMGLAAYFGGLIISEKPTGGYTGFGTLGIVSVMVSLCAMLTAKQIALRIMKERVS